MKKNEHIKRWGEKPYYSLDYYLKKTFGEKIYKVALDGGMSCPNRDGTVSTGGCIFCSNGGSGDFAIKHDKDNDITRQIETGINSLKANEKFVGEKFIAYFQSFSNTYAPVSYLEDIFLQALNTADSHQKSHPRFDGLFPLEGTHPCSDCPLPYGKWEYAVSWQKWLTGRNSYLPAQEVHPASVLP